ncbi:unnamed protein product [Amoebophrya sp. A25]|nr:unnamed protein product [Amoebophrya sp. A25]|eukprot:GSA25T00010370001.1
MEDFACPSILDGHRGHEGRRSIQLSQSRPFSGSRSLPRAVVVVASLGLAPSSVAVAREVAHRGTPAPEWNREAREDENEPREVTHTGRSEDGASSFAAIISADASLSPMEEAGLATTVTDPALPLQPTFIEKQSQTQEQATRRQTALTSTSMRMLRSSIEAQWKGLEESLTRIQQQWMALQTSLNIVQWQQQALISSLVVGNELVKQELHQQQSQQHVGPAVIYTAGVSGAANGESGLEFHRAESKEPKRKVHFANSDADTDAVNYFLKFNTASEAISLRVQLRLGDLVDNYVGIISPRTENSGNKQMQTYRISFRQPGKSFSLVETGAKGGADIVLPLPLHPSQAGPAPTLAEASRDLLSWANQLRFLEDGSVLLAICKRKEEYDPSADTKIIDSQFRNLNLNMALSELNFEEHWRGDARGAANALAESMEVGFIYYVPPGTNFDEQPDADAPSWDDPKEMVNFLASKNHFSQSIREPVQSFDQHFHVTCNCNAGESRRFKFNSKKVVCRAFRLSVGFEENKDVDFVVFKDLK